MKRLHEVFKSERLYIGYCLGICAGVAAGTDHFWTLAAFAVCFLAVSHWIGET